MNDTAEIVVHKYGGTSLASVEHLRRAARFVEHAHRSGNSIVVVVSARGKTTDHLLSEAGRLGGSQGREVDQLLATGENSSAALFALALSVQGVPAVSLTGPQAGVRTIGRHGSGVISTIDTVRIRKLLGSGHAVVVAGFQGINAEGDTVTLGRGGSDTTAVALAAELGADCHIFTDVDGVYTADPGGVSSATVLPVVAVDMMTEMAFSGARVLHPRAAELAAASGSTLVVRNARTQTSGTTIVGRSTESMLETRNFIAAVTHDIDIATVAVRCPQAPDGMAAEVFAALARYSIAVDLVSFATTSSGGVFLRFSLKRGELSDACTAIEEMLDGADHTIETDERLAKLSIIGTGLLSRPECTARMLATLTHVGVRGDWLHTTQLRTSVLVPQERAIESVAALHSEFGLDRNSRKNEPVSV